jgi:hypothetical protein
MECFAEGLERLPDSLGPSPELAASAQLAACTSMPMYLSVGVRPSLGIVGFANSRCGSRMGQ